MGITENLEKAKQKIGGGEVNEEDIEAFEKQLAEVEKEAETENRPNEEVNEASNDFDPGELVERLNDLEKKVENSSSDDTSEGGDALRKQVARAEAHESGRIDKLESRLEKLEIDVQNENVHEKAAQQRVKKVESKVDGLEDELDSVRSDLEDFSGKDNRLDNLENRLDTVEQRTTDIMGDVRELTEIIKNNL